ncbi:U1 small nuclear ribonucleoprotein 70 kDa [Macadamia integrifolia]|uniref:U1 small nuclear ribonucleoprotein 70 kDa n=1 Tax=Macadamia integrifolia TaxID=60698 RepID=UPI001C4FB3C9|nr:U1 small nuclear ribonucleoprotein 70 kDa [Macadamia integrifolia]
MSERDDDSDAPEEFTSEQGMKQDEEIQILQKRNKARVAREGKERRKRWAERKKRQPSEGHGSVGHEKEPDQHEEGQDIPGMLPNDIVNLIAAREKKVFLSDSEEEKAEEKPNPKKKRHQSSGPEPVILKDIPPAQCLQNSLDFLKQRKMQVSRSSSVLNNPDQALRLLSTCGLLNKN